MKYGIYVCLFLFVIGQDLNAGNGNSKGQKPVQVPVTTDEGSPSTTLVQTIRIKEEEHIEAWAPDPSIKKFNENVRLMKMHYEAEVVLLATAALHAMSKGNLPDHVAYPAMYMKAVKAELAKEHRKEELTELQLNTKVKQDISDKELRAQIVTKAREIQAARKAKRCALMHNDQALQIFATSLKVPGVARENPQLQSQQQSPPRALPIRFKRQSCELPGQVERGGAQVSMLIKIQA